MFATCLTVCFDILHLSIGCLCWLGDCDCQLDDRGHSLSEVKSWTSNQPHPTVGKSENSLPGWCSSDSSACLMFRPFLVWFMSSCQASFGMGWKPQSIWLEVAWQISKPISCVHVFKNWGPFKVGTEMGLFNLIQLRRSRRSSLRFRLGPTLGFHPAMVFGHGSQGGHGGHGAMGAMGAMDPRPVAADPPSRTGSRRPSKLLACSAADVGEFGR